MELKRSEFIALLREMGSDAWHLYTIMQQFSDGHTVSLTNEQLSEYLGVKSRKTIYNYMSKLQTAKLVTLVERKQESNIYRIEPIEVLKMPITSKNLPIPSNSLESFSLKEPEMSNSIPEEFTTAKDVIVYWCKCYEETYKAPYKPAWGKDSTQVKQKLMGTYSSQQIKNIIEVVFRLYEKRWKSNKYLRPTLGALTSWLHEQAFSLVQENEKEATPEPVITTEDGVDLLDEWESKGWI
jgi:hypothetical protein